MENHVVKGVKEGLTVVLRKKLRRIDTRGELQLELGNAKCPR